jgi:hypothetical protein
MALPGITITVLNNQLGTIVPIVDGTAGIILSGDAAPSGLALNTAKKIYSLKDAEDVGIDAAYDTANKVHAHRNLAEFYATAGNGAPLWIMVVALTETMEDICDKASANKLAKLLLDNSNNEIRLLGITRMPDGEYAPTYVNGLDDDAYAALVKLDNMLADYEKLPAPVVGIIEGRDFQGVAGDLVNLREASYNKAGILVCSSEEAADDDTHDGSASVGLLLGKLAAIPVQRNAGRVKDGALPITQAYLSDGSKVDAFSGLGDVHDRGYITMRSFVGKTGFYFTDDPTATALTDDYSSIARRRVINKCIQIAYNTYVNEINEEILLDADGKIHPGLAKTWEGYINNQVNEQMTREGELSSFTSVIDPDQDVTSTNKVKVVLKPQPVGYAKEIEIEIGFENPALSS